MLFMTSTESERGRKLACAVLIIYFSPKDRTAVVDLFTSHPGSLIIMLYILFLHVLQG